MNIQKQIIIIIAALIIGATTSWYFKPETQNMFIENNVSQEREVLHWVAPMDPNYKRDEPGKSPMGMDLIPVYAGEGNDEPFEGVSISPEVVQNLGVKTFKVQSGMFSHMIETVGFVGVDEGQTSHIHVRSAGWIEELKVKAEGEHVKAGDLLFRFYSPDIANAKSELVQAERIGNKSLIEASKSRLKAFGVPDDQILKITASNRTDDLVNVYAPQDGIVTKINVGEGMYIKPGTTVFSLADLSSVWINAEVFEDQASWLTEGAKARVYIPFLPGQEWIGRVDYVYPTIDQKTRTIRARLVFENKDFALKPNMYANVEIEAQTLHQIIYIPKQSLIQTGSSTHVIEALGEGKFQRKLVVKGMKTGNKVQIISGLKAGMEVVTSGQFLIDSEASFSAGLGRMETISNTKEPEVDHSKMDMEKKNDDEGANQ